MSETTVVVAAVFLGLGLVTGLIMLWRKPNQEISEIEGLQIEGLSACGQRNECPPEALDNIFGSKDLGFVRAKVPQRLRRAFRRDRRQIALKWVWSAFDETRSVMSQHFKSVRSSPDLSLALESKLAAEFLVHQAACLMLVAVIRVSGPAGLAGLAAIISNLRHHVGIVMERALGSAGGGFDKSSGLRANS